MFIIDYVHWHYTRGLRGGWQIWQTFLWFWQYMFAIPLHLRTLFARFERLGEPYPDRFHFAQATTAFVVNLMMRLVGVVVRLVLIGIGLSLMLMTFGLAVVWVLVWLAFPVVVPGGLIGGVLLIVGV